MWHSFRASQAHGVPQPPSGLGHLSSPQEPKQALLPLLVGYIEASLP